MLSLPGQTLARVTGASSGFHSVIAGVNYNKYTRNYVFNQYKVRNILTDIYVIMRVYNLQNLVQRISV